MFRRITAAVTAALIGAAVAVAIAAPAQAVTVGSLTYGGTQGHTYSYAPGTFQIVTNLPGGGTVVLQWNGACQLTEYQYDGNGTHLLWAKTPGFSVCHKAGSKDFVTELRFQSDGHIVAYEIDVSTGQSLGVVFAVGAYSGNNREGDGDVITSWRIVSGLCLGYQYMQADFLTDHWGTMGYAFGSC